MRPGLRELETAHLKKVWSHQRRWEAMIVVYYCLVEVYIS
jgi:hypothetical protein